MRPAPLALGALSEGAPWASSEKVSRRLEGGSQLLGASSLSPLQFWRGLSGFQCPLALVCPSLPWPCSQDGNSLQRLPVPRLLSKPPSSSFARAPTFAFSGSHLPCLLQPVPQWERTPRTATVTCARLC